MAISAPGMPKATRGPKYSSTLGIEAEAKKLEEGLEAKAADTKGEAKTVLEKLLTRLQDLRKAVAGKIEELKKSGAEGLKDKLLALTKDSEALSKVMAEAGGALKKKGKDE